MIKRLLIILIIFSILSSVFPQKALGLVISTDNGDVDVEDPSSGVDYGTTITCAAGSGNKWLKVVCAVQKIKKYVDSIREFTQIATYLNSDYATIPAWVPHFFPFGGPILSSERACSLKFRVWVTIYYYGVPVGTPFPGYIPLSGRAIVVGPPAPTYPDPGQFDFSNGEIPPGGKIIAFPWISNVYLEHTEDRAGPWSLGLGFTPFPLEKINESLESIEIPIGNPLVSCGPGQGFEGVEVCFNDFHFDCQPSGEKDRQGKDIYKVILHLGTSFLNAPPEAFPNGYTLP